MTENREIRQRAGLRQVRMIILWLTSAQKLDITAPDYATREGDPDSPYEVEPSGMNGTAYKTRADGYVSPGGPNTIFAAQVITGRVYWPRFVWTLVVQGSMSEYETALRNQGTAHGVQFTPEPPMWRWARPSDIADVAVLGEMRQAMFRKLHTTRT